MMSSASSLGKCTGCLDTVWSYGIQLWGCACHSNIQVIQRCQNQVLKCIVSTPWHIRNSDLHRDLGIETVTDIPKFANSHENQMTQTEETV
jgi:hypothetical protein